MLWLPEGSYITAIVGQVHETVILLNCSSHYVNFQKEKDQVLN